MSNEWNCDRALGTLAVYITNHQQIFLPISEKKSINFLLMGLTKVVGGGGQESGEK